MVEKTIAVKLLGMAACGETEEARKYCGFVLKRGADLADFRAGLAAHLDLTYLEPMLADLPWLAEDKFGDADAGRASGADMRARILSMVDDAGEEGVRLTEMRSRVNDRTGFDAMLGQLEDEGAVKSTMFGGASGRPARFYFLTRFAPAEQDKPKSADDQVYDVIKSVRMDGITKAQIVSRLPGVAGIDAAIGRLMAAQRIDSETRFGYKPAVALYWLSYFSPIVEDLSGRLVRNQHPFIFGAEQSRRMTLKAGETPRPDPDFDEFKWRVEQVAQPDVFDPEDDFEV